MRQTILAANTPAILPAGAVRIQLTPSASSSISPKSRRSSEGLWPAQGDGTSRLWVQKASHNCSLTDLTCMRQRLSELAALQQPPSPQQADLVQGPGTTPEKTVHRVLHPACSVTHEPSGAV